MDIDLSLEEFNHITSYKPGTCDCDICKAYWKKVNEWIDSGYKI
jgi:hypothetical protein